MDLTRLQARRNDLLQRLAAIGDLRPGSLGPRYRKCGKANCHCAASGARGHGPSWSLTRAVGGKTVTRVIPADAVEQTQRQIAEYKRRQRLSGELVEVSEQLCQAQLQAAGEGSREAGKKKPAPSSSAPRWKPRSPGS